MQIIYQPTGITSKPTCTIKTDSVTPGKKTRYKFKFNGFQAIGDTNNNHLIFSFNKFTNGDRIICFEISETNNNEIYIKNDINLADLIKKLRSFIELDKYLIFEKIDDEYLEIRSRDNIEIYLHQGVLLQDNKCLEIIEEQLGSSTIYDTDYTAYAELWIDNEKVTSFNIKPNEKDRVKLDFTEIVEDYFSFDDKYYFVRGNTSKVNYAKNGIIKFFEDTSDRVLCSHPFKIILNGSK